MLRLSFVMMCCSLASFTSSAAVNVVISVDWEGRAITQTNLNAMARFRNEFPDIKLLHFLNAAYFTKPEADAAELRRKINSVLRPGDEHGLHVHGWKSLFEAAGVSYHNYPSWQGTTKEDACDYDCGHTVPISVYSVSELRKVIRYSSDVLVKNGFNQPTSFRTGGWMGSTSVLQALAEENFTLDSSALPKHYLSDTPARFIQEWVGNLWPDISDTSQPYSVSLGRASIVEFPDNGCLADYVTGRQMLATVVKNVELWKQHPEQEIYVMIGFHQETAASYLRNVTTAVKLISSYATDKQLPIVFATFPLAL